MYQNKIQYIFPIQNITMENCEIKAYCFSCKEKRTMTEKKLEWAGKKGTTASCRGKCGTCSGKMYLFLSKELREACAVGEPPAK